MTKQNVASPEAIIKKLRSGSTVTIMPAAAIEFLAAIENMSAALMEGKEVAYYVASNATYKNQPVLRKQANVFIQSAIKAKEFVKSK